MCHPNHQRLAAASRRLTRVGLALMLAFAVATPLVTPARPATATMPPGACTPEEDGNRIGYNGVWYECRCSRIPGTTVWACNWVQVSKDALEANANYDYVSTELGYGGSYYAMLRARAYSIGPWEQYSLGDSNAGNGTWALRSLANDRYVTAEFGFGGSNYGILEAQAVVIDDWEKFYLYQIGSQYAFQSFLPPNSTCCYVSTEIGYGGSEYGVLRARAYSVGSWEKYWIIGLGGFSAVAPASPSSVANTSVATTSLPSAKAVACPAWLTAQLNGVPCKKLIPIPARS